ncbi:hypothetical protein [Calothrix sp. PCC 7507]|uniref:hypothetical protein n=1 Tax=Calothrix sp. PCC 7507 TaxID=99598 RepID=UPI00029F0000|nr:hypothetical protein [Calothrix sp. PCC 7507]AFY33442.1 hypothetical protein Cal7507_3029 [Calothrix sp. PCC 7507]
MLAQFQSLYPNGSIISELVQIFQGKYIVRVSVQIENVTRATGMAAAETVEVAEDLARSRALMILGIGNAPGETVTFSPKPISQVQINPALNTGSGLNESAYSSAKNGDFVSDNWPAASSQEASVPPFSGKNIKPEPVIVEPEKKVIETHSTSQNDNYSQDFSQPLSLYPDRKPQFDNPVETIGINSGNEPETQLSLGMTASNVTPFTPRNYSSSEDVDTPTGTSKKKKKSTPVDLSDVIAKTDVELQRLGWTPEQGREHLIKTYGKRGRTLLTEDELYGFLKYLESQPTPIDPLTGF